MAPTSASGRGSRAGTIAAAAGRLHSHSFVREPPLPRVGTAAAAAGGGGANTAMPARARSDAVGKSTRRFSDSQVTSRKRSRSRSLSPSVFDNRLAKRRSFSRSGSKIRTQGMEEEKETPLGFRRTGKVIGRTASQHAELRGGIPISRPTDFTKDARHSRSPSHSHSRRRPPSLGPGDSPSPPVSECEREEFDEQCELRGRKVRLWHALARFVHGFDLCEQTGPTSSILCYVVY